MIDSRKCLQLCHDIRNSHGTRALQNVSVH